MASNDNVRFVADEQRDAGTAGNAPRSEQTMVSDAAMSVQDASDPRIDRAQRRPGPGRAGSPGIGVRLWLWAQNILSGVVGATDRPGRRLSDSDVLLGFGLVALYCVLVVVAALALGLGGHRLQVTAAIAGVTAACDLALLVLTRVRHSRWMLLGFPLLLVLGEAALALLGEQSIAANYTGFLALSFVYIGLTQSRRTGPAFVVIAAPSWVLAQRPWSAGTGVKLCIAIVVWLILSEVLAARTERVRESTKRLIAQANTDVLTGLASRLLLSDQIEHLVNHPDPVGSVLLLVDLDGFKMVNDTYGHAAGDEVLMAVGERIRSCLRGGDVAARLTGDEFGTLLVGCDLAEATRIAGSMLSGLGGAIEISGGRIAVTASIGIVEIVPPTSVERLFLDAGLALFEAKHSGRNRLALYEQEMHDRRIERFHLETELRDALDGDQFEVYYQPVVHTATGATIGAEALLRWNHPERGVLAPDEFLAAAEEIGLMVPLGNQILRRACEQAEEWQTLDESRALTVAVNLSAPEMFSADLIGRVEGALEASGLPGALLVLEITERIVMADFELAKQQLRELRKLGVRVAIDDFGTGYSSLAYLRELPIDILKVDRSFVTPLGSDHQALSLLRSIVGIARALDLDVIVEGVETAAQVELLDDLGCNIVQGFYFARPTNAREITSRLTRRTANRNPLGLRSRSNALMLYNAHVGSD